MIEGFLESLTPGGLFIGWLRDTDESVPAVVEIRGLGGGAALAHAVAAAFRPDLLRGGHGHGHYGFRARLLRGLPPGPPGPAVFELFLPRHGQGVRARLDVPVMSPAGEMKVEALLRAEPAWTVADLLPSLACLEPDGRLAALGSEQFIDAAFRFALQRWPGKGEAQAYIQALDSGGASASDVLRELLTSRERRDLGPDLLSPWDPGFPFPPRAA